MEYINWIKNEWSVIADAPFIYAVTIVLVTLATSKICQIIFGAEAAASKERCELLKQKISAHEGEKTMLIQKLEAHGDDILKIKADLAAMPRIIVSETEPKNSKNGDVWLQV